MQVAIWVVTTLVVGAACGDAERTGTGDPDDQARARIYARAQAMFAAVPPTATGLSRDCPKGTFADASLVSYAHLAQLAGAPPPAGIEAGPIAAPIHLSPLEDMPAAGKENGTHAVSQGAQVLDPARYVAVLRTTRVQEPTTAGGSSFVGGSVSGTLIVMAVADSKPVCAIPVAARSSNSVLNVSGATTEVTADLAAEYAKDANQRLRQLFH